MTKSETWRGPVDVGDTMEFHGESYLETFPTAGTIYQSIGLRGLRLHQIFSLTHQDTTL